MKWSQQLKMSQPKKDMDLDEVDPFSDDSDDDIYRSSYFTHALTLFIDYR